MAGDALLQPREAVRLVQEVRRADVVVAHQAQHRRAVAAPVPVPQVVGLRGADAQRVDHVAPHGVVHLREHPRAGVVQRVVEVEQPDAFGHHAPPCGTSGHVRFIRTFSCPRCRPSTGRRPATAPAAGVRRGRPRPAAPRSAAPPAWPRSAPWDSGAPRPS